MKYPYFIAHKLVAEGLTFRYEQRVGAWTYYPVEYGGPQCSVICIHVFEKFCIADVYMRGLLVSSWTVFDRLGHSEWFIVFNELCLSESTMSAGWKCFNGPSYYNPMLEGFALLSGYENNLLIFGKLIAKIEYFPGYICKLLFLDMTVIYCDITICMFTKPGHLETSDS